MHLAWGRLAVAWDQAALYRADGTVARRSARSAPGSSPPTLAERAVVWELPALHGSITGARVGAPIAATELVRTARGAVSWRVDAPAAQLSADFAGLGRVDGTGYAECIEMTLPPWALGIRELRWGRWIADAAARSVVWIEWRGATPISVACVDGVRATSAAVGDDAIRAGDAIVRLHPTRTLHDRTLHKVLRPIGPLARVAPARFRALRQTTWLGTGTLAEPGRAALPGTTIHEVVSFP